MNILINELLVSVFSDKQMTDRIYDLALDRNHPRPMLIDLILSCTDSTKNPRPLNVFLKNEATLETKEYNLDISLLEKEGRNGNSFYFEATGNEVIEEKRDEFSPALFSSKKGPLLLLSGKVRFNY